MAVRKGSRRVLRRVINPISPAAVEVRQHEINRDQVYIDGLKKGSTDAKGITSFEAGGINLGQLEQQLAVKRKALAAFLPKEGNQKQKDKALKEFNQAKAYISKHALTKAEVGKWPKLDATKNQEYRAAVDKCFNEEVNNPMFNKMCEQLKRAAGVLDPTNSAMRNIDNYRRIK